MSQADTSSTPVDVSSFKYVVGVDIGSQTCSLCILKPDKSQVIKPTDFANAPAGFAAIRSAGSEPTSLCLPRACVFPEGQDNRR